MVGSGDLWMREYRAAVQLADDINNTVSERSSPTAGSPESQRYTSTLRRKITVLGTKLDSLELRLSKPPEPLAAKEKKIREDLIADLRSTVKQMSSILNTSTLVGSNLQESESSDAMTRAAGLDSAGLVGLQGQILKEQDEDFDKLEETVMKTKHIALSINEELDLHTRLIFDLDEQVEVTDSKLQQAKRKVAILNKKMKGGCSCVSMLLSVIGIVVLIAVAYKLIVYL